MHFTLPWPTPKSSCYIAPKKWCRILTHHNVYFIFRLFLSRAFILCLNCSLVIFILSDSSNDHERAVYIINDINCRLLKREWISSHSFCIFIYRQVYIDFEILGDGEKIGKLTRMYLWNSFSFFSCVSQLNAYTQWEEKDKREWTERKNGRVNDIIFAILIVSTEPWIECS